MQPLTVQAATAWDNSAKREEEESFKETCSQKKDTNERII